MFSTRERRLIIRHLKKNNRSTKVMPFRICIKIQIAWYLKNSLTKNFRKRPQSLAPGSFLKSNSMMEAPPNFSSNNQFTNKRSCTRKASTKMSLSINLVRFKTHPRTHQSRISNRTILLILCLTMVKRKMIH